MYNSFSLKSQRFGAIVWHGPRDKNVVAITFDDGPNPPYTDEILDILGRYGVKATFFLVGGHVGQYHELVERIAREGHAIGNHTYSHSNLAFDNANHVREEISRCETSILKACRVKPEIIRLPGGWNKPEVFVVTEEKGYTIISLSKRSFDWVNRDVDKIVKRVLETLKPGDIIGMHDGDSGNLVYQNSRSQPVEALPLIIEEIKKKGYSFVTIPEMLTLYEE